MPVNFSRCNIEEIQRSESGYFLSEKTDGVRYLMVFTGSSIVLLDRRMEAKQPVVAPSTKNGNTEAMSHILPHIQPGTVLDGEVVIHRKLRRPIFIVFDVLCSGQISLVHLPFAERLKVLKSASFRKKESQFNVFDANFLKNPEISLPLIQKNFVRRIELDNLLSYVTEEKGLRQYRNGESYNHLTDGIIFQPNSPYVMGTDHRLLKWKYLDTGKSIMSEVYKCFYL
jgi:mRNA-capping enzyme